MKLCPTCGTEYGDDQKFCPNDGSPLRGSSQTDLIGSVVAGRYHITSKLGEGGMGAVYLGEHVKMGRKSAIKVMTQSMANDAEAIARFNREAANAARINHPNVCAIYDFGETEDGLIYLAMEFIEGESLTALIKREKMLEPGRAASVLHQTADALQAAHDLGIVHRDLKPDNIMIAKGRGGADLVKVVDFGIAKAMGAEEGQNVTKTGLVVGTPEYMSPEQLSGDVLDGRSDIYSLALVFYRMLTGVLPFQADSAQETMIKRLTDEPLPLREARPGVAYPEILQTVMNKGLARMPGERYDSAAAFASDAAQAVREMPSGRATIDTEGKTQLLDSGSVSADVTDGATAPIARTRVAGQPVAAPPPAPTPAEPATPTTPRPQASPVAPPTRRMPVAAIATAVVALSGVGVYVTMTRGGDNEMAAPDTAAVDTSAVTGDTARPIAQHDTAPTQRNGGTRRDPVTPPETTTDPDTETGASQGIVVVAADAADWLFDRVLDQGVGPANAAGIRDTAEAYFNAPGMSQADRALAAYAVASAWLHLGNRPLALRWGRQATQLDGNNAAYRKFVVDLSGGQS